MPGSDASQYIEFKKHSVIQSDEFNRSSVKFTNRYSYHTTRVTSATTTSGFLPTLSKEGTLEIPEIVVPAIPIVIFNSNVASNRIVFGTLIPSTVNPVIENGRLESVTRTVAGNQYRYGVIIAEGRNCKITGIENTVLINIFSASIVSGLTISNLQLLTTLNCYNNSLTSLTLSNLPSLTTVNCYDNDLTSLTLSNLPSLRTLNCSTNMLESLSLSNLPSLRILNCANNRLNRFTISNLPSLISVNCINNDLDELYVSNLQSFQTLDCYNNTLTILTLSDLPSFLTLNCYNNSLGSLTISNLPLIATVNCYNNVLTSLTLSNLPLLITVNCYNNVLTSLTLSNLPSLRTLNCFTNMLESFSIIGLSSLRILNSNKNSIGVESANVILNDLPYIDIASLEGSWTIYDQNTGSLFGMLDENYAFTKNWGLY